MATKLNAFKREEEFRRRQITIAARARTTAFRRTTSIIGFTGLLLICLTLSKIPKIEGGYPLLLNHEILFSFALCSVLAILLNLFFVLMHLLSRINEAKFNKAVALEVIEKCLANQVKIIRALELADCWWIYFCGSFFLVYAFVVALAGYFFPYRDVSSNYGEICSRFAQIAMPLTVLLKIVVDGYPPEETD